MIKRHVNRQGETTEYALANPANEYATIDGESVQYDGTGNLSVDEEGRQYSYDEQNRLVQGKDGESADKGVKTKGSRIFS
ncbi:MAG: hypothetical protein JW741_19460 [Sedimentisphaerales bacterium]|nr:hypothetical protein [Sedimentisphaerales bacterium]